MASKSFSLLDLTQPERVGIWLLAFNALARSKGREDADVVVAAEAQYHVTDNFIAVRRLDTLEKLQFIGLVNFFG